MTMTPYASLLEKQEDPIHTHLDPADAIKMVRRMRKIRFFVRSNVDLVTEFDMNDQDQNVIGALRAAGRRLEDYAVSYGAFGTWELGSLGLSLTVRSGSNECTQTIAWEMLATSRNPDMLFRQAEANALSGVSR